MSDEQHSSAASEASYESYSSPPPAKRIKKVYVIGPNNSHEKSYLNSDLADVHFVFGSADTEASSSSKRIPAHKIILARDSDKFKAKFYGAMKVKGDILLTDVTEAAFKEFLQFFYLPKVKLSIENLSGVMNLGHRYNVTNCINVCIKFFKEVHNADNILIGLDIGIRYGHLELMTLCERFIAGNTLRVLWSKGFLECDRQLLAHILSANLFVCSEVEVFKACMAWVSAKSGHIILSKAIVDEHLGNLFYNIRFGSMTIEEFCKLSKQYDAVLSNDYRAITELIALPHIQQDRFNTQPRQIKWNDPSGVVVKCDREETSWLGEWTFAHRVESIIFSTDKKLLLTGFTINKIKEENNDEYNDDDDIEFIVGIKIHEICYNSGFEIVKAVLKMNANVPHNKSTNISLPKPIEIHENLFAYEISIEFPAQWYERFVCHSKALKVNVELDSGAVIKFYDRKKSRNGTQVIGIISALEFNRI